LRNDLEAYNNIIENVSSHIKLTENLGDNATGVILREQLVELEEYAHDADNFLVRDSLTLW
jgi:starvation-inducible DNA-binding protein